MKLSKTEKKVLHLLAWGKNYFETLFELNKERRENEKSPMTLGTLHMICWHIRQKTGIKSTKDKEECRKWEREHQFSDVQKEKGPTEQQEKILHLLAIGRTYPEICRILQISPQSAMNLASQARKRAKLKDLTFNSIREYLLEMARLKAGHLNGDPCF